MREIWIILAMLWMTFSVVAQEQMFKGEIVESNPYAELKSEISSFQTFRLDVNKIHQYLKSFGGGEFTLNIGKDYSWELELFPYDIYAEDASIRVLTENGEFAYRVPRNISFYGHLRDNPASMALFVINEDYLNAYVYDGNEKINLESVSSYLNTKEKHYLIYNSENVKSVDGASCGEEHYKNVVKEEPFGVKMESEKSLGDCYEVRLGIASDYSLYQAEGSTIQGVINYVVSIMADVALNYEYNGSVNFNDGLEFDIVEQFISTCAGCDRWTESTDAYDVLDNFSSWTSNGGFNFDVDMAQFWTDRDYDGSTVGLAYRAANLMCNGTAHHVLSNFNPNTDLLRTMTAHEIGHNLNAPHVDENTFIMYGSVVNTNNWSSSTKSTISTEIASQGGSCLTSCVADNCATISNITISNIGATGFNLTFAPTTEASYRIRVRDEADKSIIYNQTTSSNALFVSPPA